MIRIMVAAVAGLLAVGPVGADEGADGARARFGSACEAGDASACVQLGLLLEAATADLPVAWRAFHRACRMGFAPACDHRLPAPKESPAELRRRCDQGGTGHCLALALVRERGPSASRAEVAPLLRRGCLWGTAMGCWLLARSGAERSPGALAILYRGACNRGASGGCVELARLLRRGPGVWHDPRTARWAYQIGCQLGDPEACAGLREPALQEVHDSPDDREEAARACTRGDLQACADAGLAFTLALPTDRARAATLLERSCAGGNQEGCTFLAILDELRAGSCKQAAPLLDKACAAGVAQACGVREFRCGVKEPRKDLRRMVRNLELGCIGGDGETCEHLATYRAQGGDLPRDGVEGTLLAQNACDDGWVRSCPQAGAFFLAGVAGTADPVAARAPLARGCDQGDARSCQFLGRLYRDGKGVERDPARARSLFDAGCRREDADSCRERDALDAGSAAGGKPAVGE